DTEALLLRAICEQPEDDMPRLAFADFLQEQGGAVNVAWALGIRAQIALVRLAPHEVDTVSAARARVLDQPFGRGRRASGWESRPRST
ncbi:MAG: TIGR02996 domain-containing protein, partial [Gemmataceae bacterium]|nr:TIGR02996 domain-containing protein [Gemmataceae bacterium]